MTLSRQSTTVGHAAPDAGTIVQSALSPRLATIFSDQTGRFPRFSSRGNRSVMALYDYNSNAILTEPLKNNTTSELVRAQTRLTQYLLDRGLKPPALCIDNE